MTDATARTHHYFATTIYGWVAKDDLWQAMSLLKKTGGYRGTAVKGTHYVVFKVPGKSTDTYDVNGYAPQVEGTELIAEGDF